MSNENNVIYAQTVAAVVGSTCATDDQKNEFLNRAVKMGRHLDVEVYKEMLRELSRNLSHPNQRNELDSWYKKAGIEACKPKILKPHEYVGKTVTYINDNGDPESWKVLAADHVFGNLRLVLRAWDRSPVLKSEGIRSRFSGVYYFIEVDRVTDIRD